MKKNSDISERISKIIDFHKLNANSFAKALKYDRSQVIYDILNSKAMPSSDFFIRLKRSEYSEISIDWILTGQGEMIKNTKENFAKEAESNYSLQKNASVMNELYANLKYFRERCEKLEKENEQLRFNNESQSKQAG
ncbi:MAG: hypothetical protein R2764_01315 [Bacteroidales bacterium]